LQPIIEVQNLSKQYRLGTVGTGTMAHDINRWWHRVRGKEDPYLQIGDVNDRTKVGESDYVWALRGISFSVQPGEVLGIIGRNGAGKSTLLKILSRITTPTTGSVSLRGRVASLLEVGTGMHGELTGRENIYLNGAILGMRRKEIDRKLDEIIDFSGVERYIDTPVKRYSSGMHIRLGFAVAAHLEPDVLIVDEVLAVGDAEFQKRCIGKMKEVSSSDGRTILFVSHNMAAIQKLCNECLLLDNGSVKMRGPTDKVMVEYFGNTGLGNIIHVEANEHLEACILSIEIVSGIKGVLKIGEPLEVHIVAKVNTPVRDFICALGILNIDNLPINTTWSNPVMVEEGVYKCSFINDSFYLAPSVYSISIGLSDEKRSIHFLDQCIRFEVADIHTKNNLGLIPSTNTGYILNQVKTELLKIV